MEKKELIGRKVVGFIFDPQQYPTVPYRHENTLACSDLIGDIVRYDVDEDSYLVHFPSNRLVVHYPAVLIKEHLLEEPMSDDPLDYLPLIGDGVLMEVSNDGHGWSKRYVFGKRGNIFFTWDTENYDEMYSWAFARPTQKTKITRKEFESKFEIID